MRAACRRAPASSRMPRRSDGCTRRTRTKPAVIRLVDKSQNLRLTWQATQKNKFSAFVDNQPHIVYQRGYQNQISPEATAYAPFPNFFYQLNWKSTLSSRSLLDSSLTYNSTDIPQFRHTPQTCDCDAPEVGDDVISALDSNTGIMFRANSGLLNVEPYGNSNSRAIRYISSLSYVTGAHAAKFGLRLMRGQEWFNWEINGARGYTLFNGDPRSITQWATPIRWQNNVNADLGVFVQDQWTMKRLTVTGGLRYDYWDGGAEEMALGAGPYVGARSFAGTEHSPRWKDVSPRIGIAYDLFGDSKTALKATAGRFITTTSSSGGFGAPFGSDSPNPVVRSILSVTRTWGDTDRDYVPDCDLTNPLQHGECGQISNLNFGQNNQNALIISPDILDGNRQYNWDMSVLVQRQLMTGVSVSAGYYRKQFYNFTVTENLLFEPSHYKEYCVNAPLDSRLPGGGGYQMCGLYDARPTVFGRGQQAIQLESKFGQRKSGLRRVRCDRPGAAPRRHQHLGGHEHGADAHRHLLCDRFAWSAAILRYAAAIPAEHVVCRRRAAAVVRDFDGIHLSRLSGLPDCGNAAVPGRGDRAVARPSVLERRQWDRQCGVDRTGHDVRPAPAATRFPAVEAVQVRSRGGSQETSTCRTC